MWFSGGGLKQMLSFSSGKSSIILWESYPFISGKRFINPLENHSSSLGYSFIIPLENCLPPGKWFVPSETGLRLWEMVNLSLENC